MHAAAVFAALLAALAPDPAGAFTNVAVGDPIRDRELPTAGGGKAPLLGEARASVFVFFRPGSENSYAALRELFFVERELAPKGVRFVAVVSGADDLAAARATLARASVRMPLLVDQGDALYGELGVRLHPVVGVVDARRRLAAYEHFRKVGFRQIVRGRIRVVLGELTPAQMEALLAPPPSVTADAEAPARRHAALARRALERGHPATAEESARRSVALRPGFAPAHAVLARALAAQGRCDDAHRAIEEALRLAPDDAEVKETREAIRGCSPSP